MIISKKNLIWIISIIVIIASILLILFLTDVFKEKEDENGDTYDINIRIINEDYPTDIVVLGRDISFWEELQYRKISMISSDEFTTSKLFQLIIINDLDGNLSLTDEEWLFIKSKTIDGTCDFYYLGVDKLPKLKELGFYSKERNSNDLCLAVAK